MRVNNARVKPTVATAGAATFGALASMITIVLGPALQPSFPVLPYLKFDLAEVVDVTAFLLFGPVAGFLTALVHFVILSVAPGGTGPFGASLKFLAVLSTYLGIIVAARLGRHSFRRMGFSMTAAGLLTRVALMTVVNYLYIVFLAQLLFGQNYLGFAQFILAKAGINLAGSELIAYVLGLTAIFNAIHALFSLVISLAVVSALISRAPHLLRSRAWVMNCLRLSSD
jgi:riboflavin transporter FmnP